MDHIESRKAKHRCVCGYQAKDAHDLDEHITEAARSEP